jgi:Glycosyltransferase family 87
MHGTEAIGPDQGPDGTVPAAATAVRRWLDQRLSGLGCLASWLVATGLFFGMIALLGGPSEGDASETMYATWAVAHGDVACAYAPNANATLSFLPEYQVSAHAAPLWPLVSGAAAAVARIGHEVPFPSTKALGPHCGAAYSAMYAWTQDARSLPPTTGIGYLSWFALLAGVVALLRAMGRGRSGWEAAGVVLVGLSPVVWMPILDDYHPEDILALGLILGGLACVRRERWVWAGLLLGLAVTAQQFALLAVVPLVVVAPAAARGRWKLLASAVLAWAAVAVPFVAATSGRALAPVLFGTGDSSTFGGTVLWETGLRGGGLTFFARALPLVIALVFAWWVRRRLGGRALEPVPLLSLVATCLALRLVFEEGLFGYKFLVLAVMLILLAVVRRRLTVPLVAWLALLTMAFNPVPVGLILNARTWGNNAALGFDALCVAAALALIAWDASRRRVRWYLVGGVVLAGCAFWDLQPVTPLRHAPLPLWLWQVALVGTGVALAVAPLMTELRADRPVEGATTPMPDVATPTPDGKGRDGAASSSSIRAPLT